MTSAIVGTVLTAINQGDLLVNRQFATAFYWKLPLTYAVPYAVATFSALRICRVAAAS